MHAVAVDFSITARNSGAAALSSPELMTYRVPLAAEPLGRVERADALAGDGAAQGGDADPGQGAGHGHADGVGGFAVPLDLGGGGQQFR